jgi:hypothetical protein
MDGGPHWSERWSDVVLVGESDFQLTIRVRGYEFPGDASGSDAEWLVASIELCVGDRVKARIKDDPCLRGQELAGFRDELRELLAGRSQGAELVTLEEMVSLEVVRTGERFTLSGAITDHGSLDFDFDRVTTDMAALERVVAELDALFSRLPVRPESWVRNFLTRLKR